jgi:hypothetical protein
MTNAINETSAYQVKQLLEHAPEGWALPECFTVPAGLDADTLAMLGALHFEWDPSARTVTVIRTGAGTDIERTSKPAALARPCTTRWTRRLAFTRAGWRTKVPSSTPTEHPTR